MSNKSDLIELRDSVKAGFWLGSNYFHTIDDKMGCSHLLHIVVQQTLVLRC